MSKKLYNSNYFWRPLSLSSVTVWAISYLITLPISCRRNQHVEFLFYQKTIKFKYKNNLIKINARKTVAFVIM